MHGLRAHLVGGSTPPACSYSTVLYIGGERPAVRQVAAVLRGCKAPPREDTCIAIGLALPESVRPKRKHVTGGFDSVRWPGRSQILRLEGRTWLFDVAHNPAGADALASVLGQIAFPRPIVLVAAVLGDKDWGAILPPLLEATDHAVFTQAPSAPLERRWDPSEASSSVGSTVAELSPSFERALDRAKELAGAGTIVVTGSNHTVGDALAALHVSAL